MRFLFFCCILIIGFNAPCIAEESYSAPFLLRGGHLQTFMPYLFAQTSKVNYSRERWELADGDFIDLDWATNSDETAFLQSAEAQESNHKIESSTDLRPVVVLFHGLEGNSQSHYAKALMAAVLKKGWRGVVINFRGCSGEPNRLPRVYYAGDTQEIESMLSHVKAMVPNSPIYAVGYSLGGNALLKWLGESGEHANQLITRAAAISAPMDLVESANALDSGLNRFLYTPVFVTSMRTKALNFAKRFPGLLDVEKIESAQTIHDIDNAVTAVLYGASDAEDYYRKNASKPWLGKIAVPVLILNAQNDPFMPAQFLPKPSEVSSFVTLLYPEKGGHVGFATSMFGSKIDWVPNKVLSYFESAPF